MLKILRPTTGKKMTFAGLKVTNKNYFVALEDVDISVVVVRDGFDISRSTIPHELPHGMPAIKPRKTEPITVPLQISDEEAAWHCYDLRVEFLLNKDMPWAKKGYVQMAEQVHLWDAKESDPIWSWGKEIPTITKTGGSGIITLDGKGWSVTFDNLRGTIKSMKAGAQTIIEEDCGPVLDALRAPVDNDNWYYQSWYQNGLHSLQHKVLDYNIYTRKEDGAVVLNYTVESCGTKGQIQGGSSGRYEIRPTPSPSREGRGEAGAQLSSDSEALPLTGERGEGPLLSSFSFTSNIVWTVYPDGTIENESAITSNKPKAILPRLGFLMKLPTRFETDGSKLSYFGCGPQNNYADRKSGSFVAKYKSTVADQFVPFPKPQSMGNREDVRWCALTDNNGHGVQFISISTMSTSALPWSALEMTLAPHPCELPESKATHLHLDCQVTGLGGNSCGQGGPLEPDRVKGAVHQMGFIIRPVVSYDSLDQQSKVVGSTHTPMAITRDKVGRVSIVSQEGETVVYRIGKQKQQIFSAPFNLRDGGTVTAWYKNQAVNKVSATFERIENVPVEVIYTSSEEISDGSSAKNLVDGQINTIWHTMYSVTLAKYPHWVDFDCGEEKVIKGFTYLPRQDGPNGDVKSYRITLSADGTTWSQPVCEGEFPPSKKEQKVLFAAPQRARYLRFTALSSQNGADYASGAEFTVLAE